MTSIQLSVLIHSYNQKDSLSWHARSQSVQYETGSLLHQRKTAHCLEICAKATELRYAKPFVESSLEKWIPSSKGGHLGF